MKGKKRRVKNRVEESHGVGKLETEGIIGYSVFDFEGTQSLMIEFLRRTKGLDVLGVQPNECAWLKGFGSRETMSISWTLVLRLADSYLLSAVFVEIAKRSRKIVCVRIAN
jgi:hypothetical protein